MSLLCLRLDGVRAVTPSPRRTHHAIPHAVDASPAAGSSDPFAKFEVTGGDSTSKPFKSQTKYKTLCPRWNELFQVPLKKGKVQPRLEVLLYDEDEVSSPDFMGRISIEISEFCSTKEAKREWFTLLPEEGKSDNVKGAVELIAQWWYNPALDFEPFMEPDDHADASPNELRVAIVAARDLAIKDKNLLSRMRRLYPRHRRDVSLVDLPTGRRVGLPTRAAPSRSRERSSRPSRRRSRKLWNRGGARSSASSTRRGPTLRTRRSWTCSSRTSTP